MLVSGRSFSLIVIASSLLGAVNCVAPVAVDATADDASPETSVVGDGGADVGAVDAATEVSGIDAGACHLTPDCPAGYVCMFFVEGCGAPGRCVERPTVCDAVDIQSPYCSCEGTTLTGRLGDCPGGYVVPWSHSGRCDTPADAAGQ